MKAIKKFVLSFIEATIAAKMWRAERDVQKIRDFYFAGNSK